MFSNSSKFFILCFPVFFSLFILVWMIYFALSSGLLILSLAVSAQVMSTSKEFVISVTMFIFIIFSISIRLS